MKLATTDAGSEAPTCGAPKADGVGTCGSEIGLCDECGRCNQHCEHRRQQIKAARLKGGRARKAQRDAHLSPDEALPEAQTVEDCARRFGYLSRAVETGELSEKRADISRACVRDLKDLLLKDQDRRIAELEKELGRVKKYALQQMIAKLGRKELEALVVRIRGMLEKGSE